MISNYLRQLDYGLLKSIILEVLAQILFYYISRLKSTLIFLWSFGAKFVLLDTERTWVVNGRPLQ